MVCSIIEYYGVQASKCGYCKGTRCSKSHGMHAYILTCEDYQDLIDRGWRRCGHYCYKPQNNTTCCPSYTIKCNALEFKLTKSKKRILKRMNRFLRDGKRESNESAQSGCEGIAMTIEQQPQLPDKKPTAINVEHVASLIEQEAQQKQHNKPDTLEKANVEVAKAINEEAATEASGGSVGSNPPRKKAKQMRLERRLAKGATAIPRKEPQTQEKSLADFLADASDNDKHKLKLRLVHVLGDEFQRTLPQSYALYEKYQKSIHNEPPRNEQCYLDHLQDTPLENQKPRNGPDMGYGSFHQQYWLDDKLIAVGVIDILPSCISSVYFFYDPDYSFLSLGTYGSLRELELVQNLAASVPALKYYYMGFYIHSCPKMRYKGLLSPSYLLCPETYAWLLLTDTIRAKLDVQKYQRLHSDAKARDLHEFLVEHLANVGLLLKGNIFKKYGQLSQVRRIVDDKRLMEYGNLVGRICAQRMIYANFQKI